MDARSLAFHDWLATALHMTPAQLGDSIDWLFREAIVDLTHQAVALRSVAYELQRAPYVGRGFPEPGEDPELAAIVTRLGGTESLTVCNRILLHDLPGFHAPTPSEKSRKVDLTILGKGQRNRSASSEHSGRS